MQLINKAFTLAIVHTQSFYRHYVEAVVVENAVYRPFTGAELDLIGCEVAVRMKQTHVKASATVNGLQKHQLTMKAVL